MTSYLRKSKKKHNKVGVSAERNQLLVGRIIKWLIKTWMSFTLTIITNIV